MALALPTWIALGILLVLSALCAAAEAAFLSVNKVRLRHLMEQGHLGARMTYELLTQLDHVIGTLLVANNLINVAISALASWIFISLLGSEEGLLVATAVATAVILLVCEITPKMFAVTHPEVVTFIAGPPLRVVMLLLYPVATFFTWAARSLLRLLRIPTKRRSALVTEEEIKVMIQMGREAGVLAEQELRMLHRIFEFSDSTVGEVMVSRDRIVGVNLNAKAEAALDVLIEEGHSRIPVYRDTLDQIEGVIYSRDLLAMVRHGGLFVLADLIRPVLVVPETKRLAELLGEFQHQKVQIAIAKDAAGKTRGLVTIEDLIEEIVGDVGEELGRRAGRS